jgi:hypothetical protein
MTPGSVSTSRSVRHARCFSAKPRTWSCAKRMSPRSDFDTLDSAASISCSESLNFSGDQRSKRSE